MGLVSFKAGGGVITTGYKPSSITNLTVKRSQKTAALTWTDPEDFTIDDRHCTWARTILIRKQGSAPQSIHDGTQVAVITERNKHTETPWVDGVLELDVTYYYAAYIVSTDGLNSELSNIVSIIIPKIRTMTVILDLNDSNPATCGSYADDATSMPNGKTNNAINTWKEFFGYKPCLFKDGKVVGYLKPTNYTKFEDGTSADITSGDAGDVMIEFPRKGVKFTRSGKVITISMTDLTDSPEFTYYAHTRGSAKKDYFYLGAYNGYGLSDKLRSLSDKDVLTSETIGTYRQYAHANGTGYEQLTWYQWTFIQIMYVLQFRGNLNSQKTIGDGKTSPGHKTGVLNSNGLIYGASNTYMKLFGLEDLWGANIGIFMDGMVLTHYRGIYTATDNFNDNFNGYMNRGKAASNSIGFIVDVTASAELGFFPSEYGSEFDGSGTTYFCDSINISDRLDTFCCTFLPFRSTPGIGIFGLEFSYSNVHADDCLTARLSYY